MKRVQIAIPTYSGDIGAPTFTSVTRALREAEAAGWKADINIRSLDSLLPRCRNALVTEFLASQADELVFWDADIATTPGAFVQLLSHDVEIVGGAYRARQDPERYIFRPLPRGLVEDERGLIEVEGLGTGFLRISRRALDRMVAFHPELYVNDRVGGRLTWLFDFELRDHEYYSEDFVFCRRFREAGGRVWLDPSLAFHHTGMKTFSGSYARYLGARRAAATTTAELEACNARLDALVESLDRAALQETSPC